MARECVWCVFLVLACVHRGFFLVGVGAWVFLVENRGASSMEADTLSGSRSTPFERFGSHVAASLFLLRPVFVGCLGGGGVCGGLFVICIVVVSIFIFLLCGFV